MFTSQILKYRNILAALFFVAVVVAFALGALGGVAWARPLLQHEGNVVINEIMQNPQRNAGSDYDGEWFEVVNIGDTAIDINGWCIRDNGSNSHTINNGGPLNVPAGGYLVLGRNGNTSQNGGVTLDYVYGTAITLANGDDEIILKDAACGTGGTLVDEVWYTGSSPWPNPDGASMAFCFGSQNNNDGSQWRESNTATYGDGDYGTPGTQNDSCGPTVVSLRSVDARAKAGISVWVLPIGAAIFAGAGIGLLVLRRRAWSPHDIALSKRY